MSATTIKEAQYGHLAAKNGEKLPLQVLKSAKGFYIGTCNEEGPVSRESEEYWASQDSAEKALHGVDGHLWTQRLED